MLVKSVTLWILFLLGNILMMYCYYQGIETFELFTYLFIITLIVKSPKIAISPLSTLYGYYGAFYIIAPTFAERYEDGLLGKSEYILSYVFIYATFGFCIISAHYGEMIGQKITMPQNNKEKVNLLSLIIIISVLFILCTLFVSLIVINSGGFSVWISDPGDAFLNRGGTGIYVVMSHYLSQILAALVGYYTFKTKRKYLLLLFICWLIVTSPVHGSKSQISLLLILSLIPWLRTMKFFSKKTLMLTISFVLIFFLGLYFRNLSWIDGSTMLPYAFNYFTALENLAISLRDFNPDFLTTWFLPFNKFLSPFGLLRPDFYFDMNHMLTDIYYPKAWEIRATEQWPVETDLYLNFYFWGGLPLLGVYIFTVSYFFGYSTQTKTLGAYFTSTLLTVGILSHLRGSLYNHVDFYMYPYIILCFFLLKKFKF